MSSPSGSLESLLLRVASLERENARLRSILDSSPVSFDTELPAADVLAAVIQASPLPIIALTSQGKITLWNAAAERLFGWSAHEVIGQPLPFIPPEKLDEHRSMRAHDLSGQGFSGREIRRRRKDGSAVDLSVSTAPIRNRSDRIVGIMSIYVDITDRKAAEDRLHRQAELLEQAYDAVFVWEMNGTIQYWNRAATDLYGYTKEEAIGRVSHELLQTQAARGGSFLSEVRTHRRWSGELSHTTRDGRRIIVESRQVVVRTSQGTDIVLETNRDVTERVRNHQELKAANFALRRANFDLEQFTYAAAHDLQEPLRNISIFAELIERRYRDVLGQEGREFMDTVVGGAQRMQALINDLLTYTHSVDETSPEAPATDANRVLDSVLNSVSKLVEESAAVITADPLPGLPISATHLAQLLQNLIANGIKYRRRDVPPEIHISASVQGEEAFLRVADNGEGIPPEYRSRVFGLFKRLHSQTPGTGLGLAICKRIAEHYGGRIWIEDGELGQGSTVCVALPSC